MAKPKQLAKRSLLLRAVLSVVLLAAAIYILASHWHTVRSSVQAARHASIPWLAASLLLTIFTFCIAAGIYGVLALHQLRYRQTLLVEASTGFVNRLLPSGIGGLGVHGVYLYKRGHTAAEATVVVSVNNLLGIVAHLVLLGCTVLLYPRVITQLRTGHIHLISWRVLMVIVVVVLLILALPIVRRQIVRFVRHLLTSLRKVSSRSLVRALVLAMLLTTTYTLILLCSARAIGVQLGLLQIFIVFSVGMLTSTATPTPGGLVGAEAGLFAGFVAYGVSSPASGAAVLLYRLATYWLPLIPGLCALLLARSRKLV